jgi:hypothetical protein
MWNMIIILVISLILSYLFSYDGWFDVIMRFGMGALDHSFTIMQPTRTDENLGEWVERLRALASYGIVNKRIYVQNTNCAWRLDGVDWYADDHFYKCIKYVLYCEEYSYYHGYYNVIYKLSLVDITSNTFCKFDAVLPCVRDSRIFTFFSHDHFDVRTRSRALQALLYLSVYKNHAISCVSEMTGIADYTGVLISPLFLLRLRRNSQGRR